MARRSLSGGEPVAHRLQLLLLPVKGKGIGRELIKCTQAIIGEEVSLVLLSAPGAMSYYPAVGFQQAENAFVIRRKK